NLKAVIRRKRYRYKPHNPAHIADNVLNREFRKDYQSMEVLLTDVTEFKYGENAKAYLSAILDYGENKIVAFKLSKRNDNDLVRDKVRQIEAKIIPTQTLIHSDRGYQYKSYGFNNFVKKHQLTHSMYSVGTCIDDGPMENFTGIIKKDKEGMKIYVSFEELENDIKENIGFYNNQRVMLKMGLIIPI